MRRNPRLLDLYLTHRGQLLNYANGIIGDYARAEDVVQEAYLRFDRAGHDKVLEEKPVGYLYRIVRNLALDGRRQQAREERYFLQGAETAAELTPVDRPSPESEAAGAGELRALRAAMAELPERTRIALEMYRFGEATLKEIATYLGISIGLAHALVSDGLEHCRTRLGRSS